MSLPEFLLARIAEHKAWVLALPDGDPALGEGRDDRWRAEFGWEGFNGTEEPHLSAVLAVKPSRVLAECEAKRRIVEHHQYWQQTLHSTPEGWTDDTATAYRMALEWVVEQMADVYADHPEHAESDR